VAFSLCTVQLHHGIAVHVDTGPQAPRAHHPHLTSGRPGIDRVQVLPARRTHYRCWLVRPRAARGSPRARRLNAAHPHGLPQVLFSYHPSAMGVAYLAVMGEGCAPSTHSLPPVHNVAVPAPAHSHRCLGLTSLWPSAQDHAGQGRLGPFQDGHVGATLVDPGGRVSDCPRGFLRNLQEQEKQRGEALHQHGAFLHFPSPRVPRALDSTRVDADCVHTCGVDSTAGSVG
jgi:hypothetical protein